MKKIFITGIDGFVGINMAQSFLNKGYQVSGTTWSFGDNEEIIKIKNNTHIKKINILDKNSLSNFFIQENPDIVVHLAAQSEIPNSWTDIHGTVQINILGTYNLFSSILDLKKENIPILVVGAAAEYGHIKSDGTLISEEDLFHPDNPYAVSKIGEEMVAYQYFLSHGLNTLRARPFTHTGPGQNSRFVCSEFALTIAKIEKGLIKPEINVGNLQIIRDFLDVRDVINAYELILEKGVKGEVYNVCSGKGIAIGKILDILKKHSNKDFLINFNQSKVRKKEAMAIVGDNKKIIKDIGWKQKYNINDTLLDMLNYWRNRV